MNDIVTVTIVQRAHDLLKEPPRFVFWHLASFDNVIEQFSREVFDDHDDI